MTHKTVDNANQYDKIYAIDETIMEVPAWDKVPIRYFSIFHDRVLGSRPHFLKLEKFRKGEIYMLRPTRGSRFSRYWVIVKSPGVLLRKTRSLVPHVRQLRVLFYSLIGAPHVFPLLVFCCICIIRILSLSCCFVS